MAAQLSKTHRRTAEGDQMAERLDGLALGNQRSHVPGRRQYYPIFLSDV